MHVKNIPQKNSKKKHYGIVKYNPYEMLTKWLYIVFFLVIYPLFNLDNIATQNLLFNNVKIMFNRHLV